MYCVKCGVRLQEGTEHCPLCQTPVWNPEAQAPVKTYSQELPKTMRNQRIPGLAFLTALMLAVALSCLIFCLHTYKAVSWSGYVMLGIATFYICVLLPLWFYRPHPMIFIPLAFAAAEGYLLYICLYNHGHWFLSFAFPVVLLAAAIIIGGTALFRYVKKGKLIIIGGLFLALGGFTMLVELFQHITFWTKMFNWSLYTVSFLSAFGIFFLISGLIRPMREWLKRKLFL